MTNAVKANWQRQVRAAVLVLGLALVFTAGWVTMRYFGVPFSHALKVNREEVDRIVINHKVYSDEEKVTELFDYIGNFRYSQGWPLPLDYGNRSGCGITENVALCGPNLTKKFAMWNNGIVMDGKWYEWRDDSEPYFAPILP